MNIYISGICGTGMGPLALMAAEAGHRVFGSDRAEGLISPELDAAGISYKVGDQDGSYLAKIAEQEGIDWFVYTSALPEDHPELVLAKKLGNVSGSGNAAAVGAALDGTALRISKRDEFINFLISELGLKLVAVAGTHGKTTTTSMIIWTCLQLGLPVSWLAGSNLGFAKSGAYHKGDKYFIYEADEYDRNFLHFSPWLAVLPSVSYDHPDIYPSEADYQAAFDQFRSQSRAVLENLETLPIKIVGEVRKKDATLALAAVQKIWEDAGVTGNYVAESLEGRGTEFGAKAPETETKNDEALDTRLKGNRDSVTSHIESDSDRTRKTRTSESLHEVKMDILQPEPFPFKTVKEILAAFPGVGRRFERLAAGVYSDYAHHPEEIAETIAMAREEAELRRMRGVVAIYEPHQNTRQHEVLEGYRDAFVGVSKLFWLPTYLTREDPTKKILAPEDFIETLDLAKMNSVAQTATRPFSGQVPMTADHYAGPSLISSPIEGPPSGSGHVATGRSLAAERVMDLSPTAEPLSPVAEPAEPNDTLGEKLCYLRDDGFLILLMTAGPADTWLREEVKNWE